MRCRDYYEILGVSLSASAEEIRRAYRLLARQHHPDSRGPEVCEDRLKLINEAYEVLKDPQKRRGYDSMRLARESGSMLGDGAAQGFDFGGFFQKAFGGERPRNGGAAPQGFDRVVHRESGSGGPLTAEISVPLDTVVTGGRLPVNLDVPGLGARGFTIRIPQFVPEGKRIRLRGEGVNGEDILLAVRYGPGRIFRVENCSLVVDAPISPATAVLGGSIDVPTPDGAASIDVPPGSNTGQRLRLGKLGLPTSDGLREDLLVQLVITIPEKPDPDERSLYEQLARLESLRRAGPSESLG